MSITQLSATHRIQSLEILDGSSAGFCQHGCLAEMGDKTQLATAALTAHYSDVYLVVLGAALGMMLANAPSSFWASGSSRKIPMRTVRLLTTLLFLALGSMALLNIGSAVTSPMQKSAYCAAKPAENEINSYIMYSFGQLSK